MQSYSSTHFPIQNLCKMPGVQLACTRGCSHPEKGKSTTIYRSKRKLEDIDESDRPPQRPKMRQEADVDVKMEDEDKSDEVTNDFVEL